jgi:F-type H+-transporting ATPase subunit gamma
VSETVFTLRRKIKRVHELKSVVRTMKAMAAASLSQYERSVLSLETYARTVELGLVVCLRHAQLVEAGRRKEKRVANVGVLVFGSDQGMVGQFNEHLADLVARTLRPSPRRPALWAVGERVQARLEDAGLVVERLYPAPGAVTGITPLVAQLTLDIHRRREAGQMDELLIFHNQPKLRTGYEPTWHRLLPLDEQWYRRLKSIPWPTPMLPEVVGSSEAALISLVREFLFVSLFKACTESLAAENASRLAAMQNAERNIDELLETLRLSFNRRRQTSIDEELFDVISGFEALAHSTRLAT